MRTQVRIRVGRRPGVECLGKCGHLSTPRRQLPLQFRDKIGHVLGDHGARLRPGDRRNLSVFSRPETDLDDVNGVMAVGVS